MRIITTATFFVIPEVLNRESSPAKGGIQAFLDSGSSPEHHAVQGNPGMTAKNPL